MVYVIAILIGTFHFATCVSMYLFSQDRITHSFAMHSIRCIILLWWCWVLCCRGQSQSFASPMMVSLSSLLQRITWISLVSIYAAILQFWCRTTVTDWRNLLFAPVFSVYFVFSAFFLVSLCRSWPEHWSLLSATPPSSLFTLSTISS